MDAARHIARPHDGPDRAAGFDVVTLSGARGAALWRWWLRAEEQPPAPTVGAEAMPAEVHDMPALPPIGRAPAPTVTTLSADAEDWNATTVRAGVLIDLA